MFKKLKGNIILVGTVNIYIVKNVMKFNVLLSYTIWI